MNILKVEFHLQNRLESVDAFQPQMRAFGRFAIVQPLDVSIDMFFPFFTVKELLHLCRSWKCSIPQTERAIPRACKGPTVDERIALDREHFRPPQVVLTVMVPFIFAENPFTAIKAQVSKAAGGHESLFVAAIDVSPSLGRQLAMGKERGQQLAPFVEDAQGRGDVTNLSSSSLCSAIRQRHFSGSNPGRKGTSVSCRQSVIISRRTERPSSLRMGATRKRFNASQSRSGMRR